LFRNGQGNIHDPPPYFYNADKNFTAFLLEDGELIRRKPAVVIAASAGVTKPISKNSPKRPENRFIKSLLSSLLSVTAHPVILVFLWQQTAPVGRTAPARAHNCEER